ncbi:MAG: Gfo/Idh/MocA family oxidoreductase [Niabella sp.]|nr:Gfo/Idh/MocA family oxidoreductase [Niabella sp.]
MQSNRRTFIKNSALASAALVMPKFYINRHGLNANSKLNIAFIGAGNIAGMAYEGLKGENVAALCDIDARQFPKDKGDVPKFADFRKMLDKMGKSIDGVAVSTPDHTHFVATMEAMQRGLPVITQKPLTHNVWEARTLQRAKKKYKVITNMANQGHTYDGIRQMREWYEAGVFGQIKEIHMGTTGPDFKSQYFVRPTAMPLAAQPVPGEVDWDLWIGPRKKIDYNRALHPLTWRSFYDYGSGMLGDWWCHIADGPVWILDLYHPTAVECVERKATFDGFIVDSSVIKFEFPARGAKAPCTVYWYDGTVNGGTKIKHPEEWDLGEKKSGSFWFGDKQNGYLDERSNHPVLSTKKANADFENGKHIPQKYARIQPGPHLEWANAIKGGPEPGANFDYAAGLTEVSLLGVLAQRFGGRIEWDSKNMRITNRPELNLYVKEKVRSGWSYGEGLWK